MFAVLFVFGFRVPSDAKKNLGYSYTLNELAFCSHLSQVKQCSKSYVKDAAACTTALTEVTPCIQAVDKWLTEFNTNCKAEMSELNECIHKVWSEEEEKKNCTEDMVKMLVCADGIKKEEWMPLPDVRKGVRRKFYLSPSKSS